MLSSNFARSLERIPWGRAGRRPRPAAPARLRLERLEERCTPAVHDLTTGMNFTTIQAAVNAANPGDTLLADPGTYSEQVTINKPLTLEGAQHGVDARNPARTGLPATESVVDGTANGGKTAFYVTANNVTLDGFTVQGATSANQFGFGILLGAGTSGATVVNNIVQNNIAGLSLANSPAGNPALLQHNLFRNNNQPGPVSGTAIYTDQFNAGGNLAHVTIDSNAFTNNSNAAVLLGSTDALKSVMSDVTVSNNVMTGEGNGVLAFNLTLSSVTGNTITGSTGSQIVIGGGVSHLVVAQNVIQNGASRGIRIGDFGGGSPNSAVDLLANNISGNGGAGLELDAGKYTGPLDARENYWGSATGPANPANPLGTGQALIDPDHAVTFRPWAVIPFPGVNRADAYAGLTAQERFVQAVYIDALGRAGTKAELDGWVAVLTGPGGSQAAVGSGIERSPEARDHLVRSWYVAFLGRQAGGGEEQGWVNELLRGQTEEQVLSSILGSPEFFTHAQAVAGPGTPNERFVQALYLLLLNRTGGSGEVAGWVNAIPQVGRQGVALGFLRSMEYRMDLVLGDYAALLHRRGNVSEVDGWASSNLDATSIRVGFESTPEFFANG